MRAFVTIACLVFTPSIAFAQTATDTATVAVKPSRYVQAGFMVGAAKPVVAPNLMGALDGGLRLAEGPVWLHAAASWGASGDDQGPGSNLQLRAGIEGRACAWRDVACGVGGVDAGYQRGHWSDRDDPARYESSSALVAIPRLGLDVGGRNLRARIGLEMDFAFVAQRQVSSATTSTSDSAPGIVGIEANAGLAYQW